MKTSPFLEDSVASTQTLIAPARADETLIDHTGWIYWPIAFIARLPFAMMTVGVLMLVVAATGSVGLGGLTSAAVGIGVGLLAGLFNGQLIAKTKIPPFIATLGMMVSARGIS